MPWQVPQHWDTRPVCVLGGGVLGRRIAACFLAAGHNVRIRDPSEKARQQALEYIKDNITAFTASTHHEVGHAESESDLEAAVKDCWLVIEAVPEVLHIKEATFAELEEYVPDDCILASNSSSFKSGELLSKVREATKARVLNTHFMMPPEAVIVELMTSGATDEAIFPFLEDRMKEAGLHPVTALKESTGFIFNRIWAAIKREVLLVLAEGVATPATIDAMWIEQFATRKIGPCTLMDSVSLDTVEHIEEHYIRERNLPTAPLDWLKENYIAAGKLGRKSDFGGLYPPPAPGSQTRILLLNVGFAEPLPGKSLEDIMHSGEILSFVPEDQGSRPVQLIGKLPAPDGIDVARSTGRMYWTNMGHPSDNDGSVQSAKLDGTDIQWVIKPSGVHTPKQLTIDQESNKLYMCDREGLRVIRCNLDGTEIEVVYTSGDWKVDLQRADQTLWPVGITLSHKLRKIFWTQKGHSKASQGRIYSASLDGPMPTSVADAEEIISGLPECIDLEFDDETGYLYWTDRGELPLGNTLNRKQINGSCPADQPLGRQILAQGFGEGIGLRLDRANGCLYVADLNGHLWKCSTEGGLKEKLYEGPTHAYTGVAFVKI